MHVSTSQQIAKQVSTVPRCRRWQPFPDAEKLRISDAGVCFACLFHNLRPHLPVMRKLHLQVGDEEVASTSYCLRWLPVD
jgi:hypothetical protein